jgi:hypothetical protein
MARRPPVDNPLAQSALPSLLCPGAYEHVLRQDCDERCWDGGVFTDDPAEVAQYERDHQDEIRAMMAARRGEPVACRSYELPLGLPAPFEQDHRPWRGYLVGPDDVITLRPATIYREG